MIILGIDPGTGRTGFGYIEIEKDKSPTLLSCGCITTPKEKTGAERLKILFEEITSKIKEIRPDELAMEKLFFNRNVTTAMSVGEARGVILLASALNSIPVFEYTPLQVKETLSGYGRASKSEVKETVKLHLGVEKIKGPDDVADSLAIALCHAFAIEFER